MNKEPTTLINQVITQVFIFKKVILFIYLFKKQ